MGGSRENTDGGRNILLSSVHVRVRICVYIYGRIVLISAIGNSISIHSRLFVLNTSHGLGRRSYLAAQRAQRGKFRAGGILGRKGAHRRPRIMAAWALVRNG